LSSVLLQVLLTYDARGVGLIADRYAALHGVTKGAKKASEKAKKAPKTPKRGVEGEAAALNLGRELACTTNVDGISTYTKAWAAKGGRQQSENLETHEVTGLTGRYSLDALRAIVVHQTHKLTTYSFEQTIQTVRLRDNSVLTAPLLIGSAHHHSGCRPQNQDPQNQEPQR
jgi:hypothetical protein